MSEIGKNGCCLLLAVFAGSLLPCAPAQAQRARFDDFFASSSTVAAQNVPAANQVPSLVAPSFSNTPPPINVSPPPAIFQPQQAILGQPIIVAPQNTFPNNGTAFPGFQPPSVDPFQIPNQSFPGFPGATNTNPGYQIYPPANSQPLVGPAGAPPPVRTVPNFQQPQINNNFPGSNGSQFDTGRSGLLAWPERAWTSFNEDFLPRLLENPRARQTWLHGNNGNELNINDIEIATTLNWPNFFQTNEPLLFSPGFIFHFWNGPESIPGFDLPAQAYSAYLSFDHTTDNRRNAGLESNFTIGVYSDFDHLSSDSLRLAGKLLGWQRINPYMVSKFGVEYLDRVKVKLLPAFGIYATPNPDMKLDLYFPRTKLSHRVPNFNDFEVWGYVGGEYGGGSWTIERADSSDDQVDINDVRAFIGLEWIGPRRVTGFIEAGYAFERELVYKSDPVNNLDLQDTFMLRSGLAF